MTVTLRTTSNSGATTKGSALTHAELDANFLFTQSGTGAVTRTIEGRDDEYIRLLDYVPVSLHDAIIAGTDTTDLTTYVQAALDAANTTWGVVIAPPGILHIGTIAWPGNNITLRGAASSYVYNSNADPKTIFKAVAGTTIMFDLVQTGDAEDMKGNHLCDFAVDGNSIATIGIDCSAANIIERVQAKGCTTAGIHLNNFTNGTRLLRCGMNQNSGWGLQVEGVSTTTYSVEGCVISLNTLGGADIESGFNVNLSNTVFESNTGPGIKFNRPNTHTGSFGNITLDTCWFEDNASASPYFTTTMDAYNTDAVRAIINVTFRNCRHATSSATRKHMSLGNVNRVVFDHCSFDSSTASDTITTTSSSVGVAFIESASTFGGGTVGLTAAQLDAGIASGTRCYCSDKDVKRTVDAGAPAAAFTNSWVNYGGSLSTAKYWFDHEGVVHLEGNVKNGSSIGTSIFTLPAGYRPSAAQAFPTVSNSAFGFVYINADGTVQTAVGNTASFSLDGISFSTL